MLSEEIASDLEKIGIIKKELLIKGEYIAGDNKILFIFSEKNNINYIQINYYDPYKGKFNAEYVT